MSKDMFRGCMGIGIDIEDIERFNSMTFDNSETFFRKVFTKSEIEYCFCKTKASIHLAARYAGKEAVVKALISMCNESPDYKEIGYFLLSSGLKNHRAHREKLHHFMLSVYSVAEKKCSNSLFREKLESLCFPCSRYKII